MLTAKISKQSRYKKHDALEWSFSPSGRVVVRRWKPYGFPANAIAMEDLPAGGEVVLDTVGGIAEVRKK